MKVNLKDHICGSPFQFKDKKNRSIKLSKAQIAISIVTGIVALPLFVIGGVAAFYAVTAIFKKRNYKKLKDSALGKNTDKINSKSQQTFSSKKIKHSSYSSTQSSCTKPGISIDSKSEHSLSSSSLSSPATSRSFLKSSSTKSDIPIDSKKESLEKFKKYHIERAGGIDEVNKVKDKMQNGKKILLIGRSRVGKSVVGAVLANPHYQPPELFLFAGTKDPTITHFDFEDEEEDQDTVLRTLHIIDTPGVIERSVSAVRSNNEVLDNVDSFLDLYFDDLSSIDTIGICVSFQSGICQDDIEAINAYMEYLYKRKGLSKNTEIAFIVTRCENKTYNTRQRLEEQILKIPEFKAFKFPYKILFTGALPEDPLSSDARKITLRNIKAMRRELIDYIFDN